MTVIFFLSMKKEHKKFGAHWITRVSGYLTVCTTFFMLFRIDRKNITVISYNLMLNSILNRRKPWKNVDDATVTWLNFFHWLITK